MALFLKILCDISKQAKFIDAGPVASWLWLAGVGHCRVSTTDGFIHMDVVPGLVPGLKSPYRHAAKLVEVGLWHAANGGYEVHDYLAMNPSKAEVAEAQKLSADRKRKYRAGLSHGDDSSMSQWDTTSRDNETPHVRAGRAPGGASSHSDSDTASGSVVLAEESARETAPRVTVEPASRRYGPPIMAADAFHRRNCPPWGFVACRAGICIPKYLWPQWERRKSTDELAAFVATWTPQVGGDRPEDFWPRAFASHFGVTTAAAAPVADKATRTMQAAQRLIERQLATQKAVGDGQ